MSDTRPISIAPYLDILHRHRKSSLCILLLGLGITILILIIKHDVYRSTAVVVVEQAQVAPGYVNMGNSTGREQAPAVGDQLDALAHKAFSDEQLAEIVKKFGLYGVGAGEPVVQAVDNMERHLDLVVPQNSIVYESARSQSGAPDVLNISFEYRDRLIAQQVTAELASIYIAEAYSERIERADDTLRFLSAQVAETRAKLDAKSNQVKEIERRYEGSLPSELEANLAEVARLQDRLTGLNQQQITERMVSIGSGQTVPRSPDQELTALQLKLIQLRSEYSDQYPDVVQLKQQIAELKRQIAQGDASGKTEHSSANVLASGSATGGDRLDQQIASVTSQIETVKARIAASPVHGEELATVTRDYDAIQAEYQGLLSKQVAAQLTENLEKRHQDERLRLLEPASLPRNPVSPDRVAIGLLGISFSLIAALALPFGLYFTDTSFKHPDEIQEEFGIPVVATIPTVQIPKKRKNYLPALIASSAGILVIAIAIWAYAVRGF